ncbi:MAG: hypothetical protein ACI398_04305 [Clostridium sp.]
MIYILNLDDIEKIRQKRIISNTLLDIIESDYLKMKNDLKKYGINFCLGSNGIYILYEYGDFKNIIRIYGEGETSLKINFTEVIKENDELYYRTLLYNKHYYAVVVYGEYKKTDDLFKKFINTKVIE